MPIKNAYNKVYLIKLNSLGQREWGTYYGGDKAEQLGFVALDSHKDIYLYGLTNGSTTGIATPDAHQATLGSLPDTFLAKFRDCQSTTTASSNSPVCINNAIELHATGGTNYSWTGPNGFLSSDQDPIILNATALNNGQYSCAITGTGACDNTITIDVLVEDTIAPIPNIATLPDINGDCNTIVATIPTATDNCAGTITATTADPLIYAVPGNYTIHWNYNDGNGNTSSQNQSVVITAIPIPTLASPQDFCVQENAFLNDITITGQNIQWYDALVGGNLLANTTPMQHLMMYYASQTINGCESLRASIQINIYTTPAPTGDGNQSFCSTQNATLNDVVVNGSDINWYATASSTTVLPLTTTLVNGTTYYATQTVINCESVDRLAVTISLINTLNATDYDKEICDDLNDETETVLLTDYNTSLIANVANYTFTYYNSLIAATNENSSDQITNLNYPLSLGLKTIYVRITSSNSCHQIVELKLTLLAKPIIPIKDIMPICEGSSITVSAGLGFDSYLWSTGEVSSSIVILTPGNYYVTVTKNHATINCSSTKNFTVVKSSIATISEIITSDWTVNENIVTILLAGNSVGNYDYSLDGIHYQNSNVFSGLASGEYTVFVRDKNGCGILPEDFYLLMYPKFFTPNGDGFNDTWKIKFSTNEPGLKVRLFDRFGKFLKELDNISGWNGTLNNQELPATDYWFVVTRENGKEYRGHFALKR